MTQYESDVKAVPYSDRDIFRVLSDLQNLEKAEEFLPGDKISDFSFDSDTVSFRVDPVGKVSFRVMEREPDKLVKFKSERLPFDIFLWIQLVPKADKDTRMKITVRADLNPFIKGMVDKPLREVVEKISEALARLPYDRL